MGFFSADKCSHLLPGTFTIIKIICCTWLSKQWQRPLWAQTLGLDNRSTSPPLCRCRHLFCPCYKGLLWSWPFFFVQDNKSYEFVKQTGGEFRSHTDARYSCDTMTCPDPWATEVLRSGFCASAKHTVSEREIWGQSDEETWRTHVKWKPKISHAGGSSTAVEQRRDDTDK